MFALALLIVALIVLIINVALCPTIQERDYQRRMDEEAERQAAYKIIQVYLDEVEREMFYRDGEYRCGNNSALSVGDNGEGAVRTVNNNDIFTVDFSSALTALKEGKRIKRLTWNVSMRLHADGQIRVISENGDIAEVVTVIGIFDLPFRLEDIFAEDWQIID